MDLQEDVRQEMAVGEVFSPVSEHELDELYELFAKSFPPRYFQARSHFEFIRRKEPHAPYHNYLLVRGINGELAGGLTIVDREMMLDGCSMRTAGISYYAIAPEYQAGNCTRKILKALFDRLKSGSYDLSVGIASKAMDGYWSRYGFFGFTAFSSMTVEMRELRKLPLAAELTLSHKVVDDEESFKRIYKSCYGALTGSIDRDEALWSYWFSKIARRKDLQLVAFRRGADCIGYVVYRDNAIIEIAVDTEFIAECVRCVGERLSNKESLALNLPPSHPVFNYLRQFNHSYSIRRVWNGGHIALVLDEFACLRKLQSLLERRLIGGRVASCSVSCNKVTFHWNGNFLSITEDGGQPCEDRIEFHHSEWQKVLLGVEPPKALKGFRSHGNTGVVDTLFPVLWPQVAELDEF